MRIIKKINYYQATQQRPQFVSLVLSISYILNSERRYILKTGNAKTAPLILKISLGDHDHLPSSASSALFVTHKKKVIGNYLIK